MYSQWMSFKILISVKGCYGWLLESVLSGYRPCRPSCCTRSHHIATLHVANNLQGQYWSGRMRRSGNTSSGQNVQLYYQMIYSSENVLIGYAAALVQALSDLMSPYKAIGCRNAWYDKFDFSDMVQISLSSADGEEASGAEGVPPLCSRAHMSGCARKFWRWGSISGFLRWGGCLETLSSKMSKWTLRSKPHWGGMGELDMVVVWVQGAPTDQPLAFMQQGTTSKSPPCLYQNNESKR